MVVVAGDSVQSLDRYCRSAWSHRLVPLPSLAHVSLTLRIAARSFSNGQTRLAPPPKISSPPLSFRTDTIESLAGTWRSRGPNCRAAFVNCPLDFVWVALVALRASLPSINYCNSLHKIRPHPRTTRYGLLPPPPPPFLPQTLITIQIVSLHRSPSSCLAKRSITLLPSHAHPTPSRKSCPLLPSHPSLAF